jgi:broad specificity phosphatase PhoE
MEHDTTSTPPATLVLVRHGHTKDNDSGSGARLCGWTDPPLSSLGWAQVLRLRAHLAAERGFTAVYASPLRRARDTAEVLARRLQVRLHTCAGLREIGCGVLDGWPLEEVRRSYAQLWRRNLAQTDEAFGWPGGESYRAFRSRCLATIRGIAAAHPGERVLVVTHAGVISQIMGALAGTSAARWEAFRAGNASITELRWCGTGGAVVRFDVRDHLQQDAGAMALPSQSPGRPDTRSAWVPPLPPPEGVGAPDDPQVVARRPRGVGARPGWGSAPAVRDEQVVPQGAGEHIARPREPVRVA